jgi:hypothetical protein
MNSSLDFTVVTNLHLSVEIHCLKVMFLIVLSVNTSSNVFSKSVGPGHALQSWQKKVMPTASCYFRYFGGFHHKLHILVNAQTHALCVPPAPTIIQFLGHKDTNFEKTTLTPGCEFLKLHNNNHFCSYIMTPLTYM